MNPVTLQPLTDRIMVDDYFWLPYLRDFFRLIDQVADSDLQMCHSPTPDLLSIHPGHFSDLCYEALGVRPQLVITERSLTHLVYPRFLGVRTIKSAIWHTDVDVWQFQFNLSVGETPMHHHPDNDLLLDQALASVRIWRQSLEADTLSHNVTYCSTDLVYKLQDIEDKLKMVQGDITLSGPVQAGAVPDL